MSQSELISIPVADTSGLDGDRLRYEANSSDQVMTMRGMVPNQESTREKHGMSPSSIISSTDSFQHEREQ